MRAAVLPDVDQALLHDASQFPAHFLRQFHLLQFAGELGGNPGFTAETFHRVGEVAGKPFRIDFERLHLLHQFPQLEDLFPQQFLDA